MEITIEHIFTALSSIAAVISVLAGVIAYLYKILNERQQRSEDMLIDRQGATDKKLDECEASHRATHERIISISEDLGRLKGMEAMHDAVLREVRSIKDDS